MRRFRRFRQTRRNLVVSTLYNTPFEAAVRGFTTPEISRAICPELEGLRYTADGCATATKSMLKSLQHMKRLKGAVLLKAC